MSSSSKIPALLGGQPVLEQGPPKWPVTDDSIRQVFRTLESTGAWGMYHADETFSLTKKLQSAYQCERVTLCASGTVAVELALRGLKIQNGDEVVLAAYDFKANFINVTLLGATPVLVDINADDAQLNVDSVEEAITPQTKAIIASHLHGGTVELLKLREIADRHDLAIIEDCCQTSHAARIENQVVGTLGDVTVLSFGGSKLLSCGRGGAVLTNRNEIGQRILLYNERGNAAYPLSEVQAALLVPQLEQLEHRHQLRLEAVEAIGREVENMDGLSCFPQRAHTIADFYKLGFWYDSNAFSGISRDLFCKAMRAEGVSIDPGFGALHKIHSRRRYRQAGRLSNANAAHEAILLLHHPFLMQGKMASEQFQSAVEKIREYSAQLQNEF